MNVAAVPEASVDIDGEPSGWEDDVGSSSNARGDGSVYPKPQPTAVQHAAKRHFRSSVAAALRHHSPTG